MNGLVLSGGGARAAYQVGVLSYLAEKAPDIAFPIIVGVSAGSINAAFLAGFRGDASEAMQQLGRCWCDLSIERVFRSDLGTIGVRGFRWVWTLAGGGSSLKRAAKGLVDTQPLREFLTAEVNIEGIQANIDDGQLRALGLTVTNYATGQTITFVQGAPDVTSWERVRRSGVRQEIGVEHVMASCSLPLIFPAIELNGVYYGDGSIRQSAPLAPAIHIGADRLLAVSTRYQATSAEIRTRSVDGYPPPAQIISMLFSTVFLDTLEADVERLKRLNNVLAALPPGQPAPEGLREIDILVLRPSKDLGELASEYKGKLPRSVRFMLRGLGAQRVRQPDLLSYLLFERPYVSRLIELGYEDALSQWAEIEAFFLQEA